VQTGREVSEGCARALKDSVLELGGNDPMIVLEDADVEHAVAGALWGGFANAGQSGAGVERIYVMREVFEPFISALVSGAKRLALGNPLGWDTEVGPLTSREQFDRVCALVDEAVADGAQLRCGGPVESPPGCRGSFFAPAVLTDVTPRMRIMREETFGPAVAVVAVESEDEALSLANDTSLGLGASVWTSDRCKGELFARELQAGMVWINDHMFTYAVWQCPWGGIKNSGIGRTHSRFGLYECVDVKLRSWESSRFRDPWWHPYDETLGRALRQTATMLYGRPSIRASALRQGAVPLMRLGIRVLRK
jgi:acyl-CoA reductase-like NAD-dependent aldehyde dehydrogenase